MFSYIALWIRSAVFTIVLYFGLSLSFITGTLFLYDARKLYAFFIKVNQWTQRWVELCIGVQLEIYGQENIQSDHAIYAIRHESAWETLVLLAIIPNVCFVLKSELAVIPAFGSIIKKLGMIKVNRKDGLRAISIMANQAETQLKKGSNIIIFPEGTRMPSGKFSRLHHGIYAVYRKTKVNVIPVVLNSGKVWPRRSFIKHPGCIKMKFMPPITPGLSKTEFMSILEENIMTGTKSL